MSPTDIPTALAFLAMTVPVGALAILGLCLLFIPTLSERRVHQIVGGGLLGGLIATLGIDLALAFGGAPVSLDIGSIIAVRGFHINLAMLVDGKAALFLTLDYLLCGLVGLFSARYLHQEEGFRRFYLLLTVFAVGVSLIAAARGLDLLFAGWELVGLSSALLIAFFHRRPAPVSHGLRAYGVYRVTDVGLLMGVVLSHHLPDAGASLLGTPVDGHVVPLVAEPMTWLIGGLLIFGAMGKGAAVPFTGWLPRAMEGPTPSSAIFYGALSIHASPFLLVRIQPLLDTHIGLRVAVVTIGLISAAHASMVGRVQSDIKSSLGYASVAQVGLMWVWAGLGWETLAMVHIAGHAALRTWQLLRAPSLLHDRYQLSTLLGHSANPSHVEGWLPARIQAPLYAFALNRWHLDELLAAALRIVLAPLRALERADVAVGLSLEAQPSPTASAEVAAQ